MTEPLPTEATIDCHAHIFTSDMALQKGAWTAPKADASLDRYRNTLHAAGIRHAVLAASSLHADDSEYSTAATHAHRDMRTTVIVPPETGIDRLRQLDSAGACGIRLQLRNKEVPDLRSPAYRKLLQRIGDLGWHVQLHDDSHRLPRLIDAIEPSGVPLVIDHFGRPGLDGVDDPGFRAVLAAVERGRTWVKISGAFRLEPPALDRSLATALLAVRGPDRLLWGSDWPFVGFEDSMTFDRALAGFARAVPDAAQRVAINRTALCFYFNDIPDSDLG